jgi:nitroreductase
MNRRNMILAVGGSALALFGGAAGWRVTRLPTLAMQPWDIAANRPSDVRLDAFRHAILAPNPHNRQPWLIKIVDEETAVISCDLNRRLPETDPFDRQTTIGFGCFLELARIAAAERGFEMTATLFPDGAPQPMLDGRPIAKLVFTANHNISRDPLYPGILKRRSNKGSYDSQKRVSGDIVSQIVGGIDGAAIDESQIAALREQVVDSMIIEQTTRRTCMESVELTRIGYKEINEKPDGIDLGGPLMETLSLVGQLDREQLADPKSGPFKAALDSLAETHRSIPALIWIKTTGNTRFDQIEAGRRYVRANLQANLLGIDMHPMSQSLQEYVEVSKAFAAVHGLLGAKGEERIQMLARIGYGSPVDPAPRWPLEDHLT